MSFLPVQNSPSNFADRLDVGPSRSKTSILNGSIYYRNHFFYQYLLNPVCYTASLRIKREERMSFIRILPNAPSFEGIRRRCRYLFFTVFSVNAVQFNLLLFYNSRSFRNSIPEMDPDVYLCTSCHPQGVRVTSPVNCSHSQEDICFDWYQCSFIDQIATILLPCR